MRTDAKIIEAVRARRWALRRGEAGLTLTELLLAAFVLALAITALMSALLSQTAMNEHSRNLSWATIDANRVLEQLREQNTGAACVTPTTPSAIPPVGFTSWDAWLAADVAPGGAGGKNVTPTRPAEERVFVTCQRMDAAAVNPPLSHYCGNDGAAGPGADQVGTGEWRRNPAAVNPPLNPLRVTVSVCWRHRNRTIGECQWTGAALNPNESVPGNGVIDSPVIATTVVTCHP